VIRRACRQALVALGLVVATHPYAIAQEPIRLLVASDQPGIALRWAWGEGERPAGWLVDRRVPGGSWLRLTPQPLTRVRDRAVARARLGDRFARYEGLLFPDDPRAELADPESHRSLQLLAADVDADVARLLGLRFDDRSAPAGTRFEYRLVALTGAEERVVATSGAVEAGRYSPPAGPDSLRAAQGRSGIGLRWDIGSAFSAYHVYRGVRADGVGASRLNSTAIVVFFDEEGARTQAAPTFFTDTAPAHAGTFYYQVEGVDAFGRTSRRSTPLAASWRDLEAPAGPTVRQALVAGDTVVVSWEAPATTDLAGFQVWRADSSSGPFERVGGRLPVRTRELRDPKRPSRRASWYRVTAIDSAGHESEPSALTMVEVPDLIAPPVPSGVAGVPDTGRIVLSWSASRVSDLRGYRIYRASTDSGSFAMLTDTLRRDTTLVDRIPTAADHAYHYRVTAVDSAFNESAPSATVAVRPPDHTPPTEPRITSVRGGDRSIRVEWLANVEPDVVAYLMRYRGVGESRWLESSRVPAAQRSGTISGLDASRRYEVALVAIDDAGNVSPQSPMLAGAPLRRAAVAPELRRARYESAARAVRLEWANGDPSIVELLVLRRLEGGTYRVIGTAASGATTFTDESARPGVRYEYALRARDRSGNLSDSRARSVTTPELSP